MKINSDSGDRLILRGIPQGRGLIFGFFVCLTILIVGLIFAYILHSKSNSIRAAIGPLIGAGFMSCILLCLILASLKRERLTLDKVTQTATHETWSLLFGTRKSKSYHFDRIHAVAIEKTLQAQGGGKGFPIQVTKARLLILGPRGGRQAVDLDEAQSGGPAQVEALAQAVAQFLNIPLKSLGSHEAEATRHRKSSD